MNNKFFLIVFLLLGYTTSTYAQHWDTLGTALSVDAINNVPEIRLGFGISNICTDKKNNVYVTGYYINKKNKYFVSMWDGKVWKELGGEANSLNSEYPITAICTDANNNVYALVNNDKVHYVAQWNGVKWKVIGGKGASEAIVNSSIINRNVYNIIADKNGNVYAAGLLSTDVLGSYFYMAKWNGTAWSKFGSESGAPNFVGGMTNVAIDGSGKLYAVGIIDSITYEQAVLCWEGNKWSKIDGYQDIINNYSAQKVLVDAKGNIYASGPIFDSNKKECILRYDALMKKWTRLTVDSVNGEKVITASNIQIEDIALDSKGSLYVVTSAWDKDKKPIFIIKYMHDNSWQQVGTGANALSVDNGLPPNYEDKTGVIRVRDACDITTITIDNADNILAGGTLYNASNKIYLVKYK